MRLYYLGQPGDKFGWGICNTNLIRELGKLCDLIVPDENRKDFESPCFVPIADHALRPSRKCRSPHTVGYTFFEQPLEDEAAANAQKYKWIFAGSDWCTARLKERGINHSSTLVQGVDFTRFPEMPWPDDRPGFRVFSGGKLEYRKGQDIVVAAMRVFLKQHPDACLVTQWFNPWPLTTLSIKRSNFCEWGKNGEKFLDGIDPKKVVTPDPVPNEKIAGLYAQCDVGLFPNRCEGGTNLVLMEFMATGRPVIATYATGHKDVLHCDGPLLLTQGSYEYPSGWFHADVSDCLVQLERLYKNRDEMRTRGKLCRASIEQWTWERAAKTIYDQINRC